jgi:hypothetical protein
MPVHPIDIMIPVKRSPDIRQMVNTAASQRPEYLQQQFAERLKRQVVHNDKHVRQTDKTDDRTNGRGKSQQESRRENRDKETKRAALYSFMGRGSLIDLRV